LGACATVPERTFVAPDVTPFSDNRPGRLPRGWQPFALARHKAPTHYETTVDAAGGRVVLHARAERAASGLKQRLDIDPTLRPRVAWEWRVMQLIEGADNTDRHAEDAPVRLLLFFDGDRSRLPAHERAALQLAELISGRPVPYATLMYIWSNRGPVDTVIESPYTRRIQMIVVGAGAEQLGQWKRFERDYVADYRRAFGEAPGRLIGVGILTDTDNTGAVVEAFYGDIRLQPLAR
ncbi:MAG: DUF3047 domain-containing protein, partial [Burkholderiaceae bacterium]|nr:DUF3047 domain-containing protein [Burkholderiaceae bacterium]